MLTLMLIKEALRVCVGVCFCKKYLSETFETIHDRLTIKLIKMVNKIRVPGSIAGLQRMY